MTFRHRLFIILFLLLAVLRLSHAQDFTWTSDGTGFFVVEENDLVKYDLKASTRSVVVSAQELQVANKTLSMRSFYFSPDGSTLMIYTNTSKVWRLDTRGDYWTLNLQSKELRQLGGRLPASSLMFAKFSPDSKRVAYVSANNLYVEMAFNGVLTVRASLSGR
jgi:dipeptidyl-peptidase 4